MNHGHGPFIQLNRISCRGLLESDVFCQLWRRGGDLSLLRGIGRIMGLGQDSGEKCAQGLAAGAVLGYK